MKKIAHLSSVHSRYDTRIFLKECTSLSKAGYDTYLVIADGLGDETKDGVSIIDVGVSKGRLNRMLKTTKRVYQKALEIDADLYHLHDPELMPAALKLKSLKKTVVFDAHEDTPKQILSKHYLSKPYRIFFSTILRIYEKWVCKKLDTIITATPAISKKMKQINKNTITINNYPLLDELISKSKLISPNTNVSFVGGISKIRGLTEVVEAIGLSKKYRLNLAGKFSPAPYKQELEQLPGWENVDYQGVLNREEVRDILSQSIAGIITYLPLPNHIEAQPNKLFEYMSASIPVIASNFPLWRNIVEKYNCGICVDPASPIELLKAIDSLASNPQDAKLKGENGRKAVENIFNWENESIKLIKKYQELLP